MNDATRRLISALAFDGLQDMYRCDVSIAESRRFIGVPDLVWPTGERWLEWRGDHFHVLFPLVGRQHPLHVCGNTMVN